ncbi:hypothetical protein BGZ74_007567 [Mortierella antarctica]|nr:hypothetical protein BGZ74_007567 [Mortierella antarctica]
MISHSCPLCVQIFERCLHQIEDDRHFKMHTFDPLPSARSKGSSSSSDVVVPHGIIRQIYGPPQRRRRFVTPRMTEGESADERSIAEQQEQRLERRREVYRHKLFVKHMGANKISGFQQITPESFKIFPQRIERLVPWIRRELQAILTLSHPASASSSSSSSRSDPNPSGELMTGLELIREYITAVLKRYDLQTDQAQDLLRDFLHEHTEHFVHEMMAFARSPFSMEAYDAAAQYDTPRPRQDGPSGSRSEDRTRRRDRRDDQSQSFSRNSRRKRGRSRSLGRSRSRGRSRSKDTERHQRRLSRSRDRRGGSRPVNSNRHGKQKEQASDTLINRPKPEASSEDEIMSWSRGGRTPSASSKEAVVGPSTSSSSSTLEHVPDKDDRTAASLNNALHGLLQAKLEREKALYLARQG